MLGATSLTKESPASDAAGRDVSNQWPGLLQANAPLWERHTRYLYADNASSAGAYLNAITGAFDGWSVRYNKWTVRWCGTGRPGSGCGSMGL